MRRSATGLVALAAAAALLGVPAEAWSSDEVRVQPEGAAERTVTLSGLGEPDVRAREYSVGDQRVAITGHSLDRVLGAARVDPYRFGDVEVEAGGAAVTLGRDEVTDADAFPDGPPVLWSEAGAPRFLRPASAAGGAVQLGGAGPVTIRLSRASPLRVQARASARQVDQGEPVTFTATVSGAGAEPVDVSWYFDDGRSGKGLRVTHRFRKPGTYDVVVGATTSSDDAGADATVSVRVGRPPDGPDRKGGGTSRDAGAPDSGPGTGPTGSGASRPPDDQDDEGIRSGRGEADAPRERAPVRDRSASRRSPRREPRESDGGRQVRGIELATLSPLSSDAGRDALRAARRGRLRDDGGSDPGIPPAVWWTVGVGALLALGAWREARSAPVSTAR